MNAFQPSDPSDQPLSVARYLELEENSDVKHEFYRGQMRVVADMAGTTLRHNRLVRRVANLIEGQPANRRCGVFTENIKVEVIRDEYLPYPDIILTCHPFDLQSRLIVRQPSLLVEVLSDSSEKNDRGFKWLQYKTMLSLLYYLLVDQHRIGVELYSRVENTDIWTYQTFDQTGDVVVFPRLDFELTVGAIYDGIDLTVAEEELPEPAR